MRHFVGAMDRIGYGVGLVGLGLGLGLAVMPAVAAAQANQITQIMVQDPSPLVGYLGAGSQGYLGVELADVDQDKAQALKLKEVRGAVITLIDHDAPAGQANLKVNDVVVQFNGQAVEGAEQLRRLLKEIPAGRKVQLAFSRDGNVQTVMVELADRRKLEKDAWDNIGKDGDVFPPTGGTGLFSGVGDAPLPGGFHMPFFGSTLKVGAVVEPLTSQTADYLGVTSGLMVKQVVHKTEAEKAGLKVKDVILKVGTEPIVNLAGWDRALRSNEGKPVQVTILRDGKQQTLTLQVDSKRHGQLQPEDIFPNGDGPLAAGIEPDLLGMFGSNDEAAAKTLREQAESLQDQIRGLIDGQVTGQIGAQETEQFRKQTEQFRDSLKGKAFEIDPNQTEEFKQQMDQFQKNFKPEDFKLDEKQLDEWKLQIDRIRKQLNELKKSALVDPA